MLKEVLNALPILFLCMVGNIATGTLSSLTIDKIKFDKVRFFNGVLRAAVTAIGFIILAYAFDRIDLSSIGFAPMTVISAGIIAYAGKMAKNLVKLIGLSEQLNNSTSTVVDFMTPKSSADKTTVG